MNMVINKCGRFALIENKDRFRWQFMSRAGEMWHWDPLARGWTGEGRWSRTREEASAGLESMLVHQTVGT